MSLFLLALVPNNLDARVHQSINGEELLKFLGWFCSKNNKMLAQVSSRFFCQCVNFYSE